jgi:hypothetical protein
VAVNVGKTLFAQIMEFVPWSSFARIVQRYRGNAGVRTFSCAEQFRAMAFAQLTWRESLRDIEVSLSANANQLYAMGFRRPVKRSTLAEANESRDWRIWSDLAALLIARARKLYASQPLGVELDNTVYALDSTTIDLCLSLFDWAPFRSTKAAIKLHTLLDLRGSIPSFIHISDGKLHDVNVLDILPIEAGSFYLMDRGYVDFARLYAMHQGGTFFVTRAKHGMNARRIYSAPTERASGVICDQRVMLEGFYPAKNYPEHLRRVRFKDPESGKTLVFLSNNMLAAAHLVVRPCLHQLQTHLPHLIDNSILRVVGKAQVPRAVLGGVQHLHQPRTYRRLIVEPFEQFLVANMGLRLHRASWWVVQTETLHITLNRTR